MTSKIQKSIKVSSLIKIPQGMYFVPAVHRALLAYRTLSDIEHRKSLEDAVSFAKSFILKNKNSDDKMTSIYQNALTKYDKISKV